MPRVKRSALSLVVTLCLVLAAVSARAHTLSGLEWQTPQHSVSASTASDPVGPINRRAPAPIDPQPADGTVTADIAAWGWWLTALLSAAGAGAALGRRRPSRRALAIGFAGLFAFFILGSSPHLVHHLLDPDKGARCPVYQATQRVQLTVESPFVLPPPVEIAYALPTLAASTPQLAAPAPRGRAPPA